MIWMSHTDLKFKFIIRLYDKSFYPDLFHRQVKVYTTGTIYHLSIADHQERSGIKDTLDSLRSSWFLISFGSDTAEQVFADVSNSIQVSFVQLYSQLF